jgi:predicted nucleic acid-binding protein
VKIFLDTNVLVSAFSAHGLCADLLRRLLTSNHLLLIGEPVREEFVRIMRTKFRVPETDLAFALEVLDRQIAVPRSETTKIATPDPADAPILACAEHAGAELFVTGDKALLELKRVAGTPIVSPRKAWEILFLAK